jgi:hypothetical protein
MMGGRLYRAAAREAAGHCHGTRVGSQRVSDRIAAWLRSATAAIALDLRFTLSYRDVEELLAERGLDISYETVRRWVLKFGPAIARRCASAAFGRAIASIWTRVRRERTTSNGSAELHRR